MPWLALAALLWTSPASAAREDPTLAEVTACAQLAVPDTPRVWSIAFTTRTRAGAERDVRANIFTRHDDLERRVVVLRVTRPSDLEGSTLLLLEREGPNEIFFSSPELEQPVRITGDGAQLSLFGTDFSYEDVERMYGLNRPVESRRLDDALVRDQPVYVVESKPSGGPGESAYEAVVAFIAKDTCVPLRTEFYETDRRLRKVLTIDPRELRRHGTVWIAHSLLMSDLLDESETRLIILSQDPTTSFPELPNNP